MISRLCDCALSVVDVEPVHICLFWQKPVSGKAKALFARHAYSWPRKFTGAGSMINANS